MATEHFNFPLPSPSHMLEEDVHNIADAITGIDGKLYELDSKSATVTDTVDTVQAQIIAALAVTAETEVRVAVMEERLAGIS